MRRGIDGLFVQLHHRLPRAMVTMLIPAAHSARYPAASECAGLRPLVEHVHLCRCGLIRGHSSELGMTGGTSKPRCYSREPHGSTV